MSDDFTMGEFWRDVKEARTLKKLNNLESSLKIMSDNGFNFQQLGEAHFRFEQWDFWPTTGKYYDRVRGYRGRGVFRLLRAIKKVKAGK